MSQEVIFLAFASICICRRIIACKCRARNLQRALARARAAHYYLRNGKSARYANRTYARNEPSLHARGTSARKRGFPVNRAKAQSACRPRVAREAARKPWKRYTSALHTDDSFSSPESRECRFSAGFPGKRKSLRKAQSTRWILPGVRLWFSSTSPRLRMITEIDVWK